MAKNNLVPAFLLLFGCAFPGLVAGQQPFGTPIIQPAGQGGSRAVLSDGQLPSAWEPYAIGTYPQQTESPAQPNAAALAAAAPAGGETDKKKEEAEKKKGCQTCCNGLLIEWSKYPSSSRPFPRPGIFSIPPKRSPATFTVLDYLNGDCKENPRKSGYAPFAINAWSFYDADWRFVEEMEYCDRNLVERLKRIHLNDCWMLGTGGQYWLKYHNETNSRLTGTANDFTLYQFRMYTDLWYSDFMRIYGEYIWADMQGNELAPLQPDIDKGDIHNLFVDLRLFDWCDKPVFLRSGRQELLFGSQRMISPLPWANKRNAFDGFRLFRQGDKWDADMFWTQFVPASADDLDEADPDTVLAGTWLTHRPEAGQAIDLYWLFYDNDNRVVQQGITRTPADIHTTGTRWSGDKDGNLWDFEGAIQFGEQETNDLFAGMASAGLGRHWKDRCGSPTAWLYYDFASGDGTPNSGTVNTYNQLFPFGHYYTGWTDIVGRQNIHDVNAHLYVYPVPWCTVWLQYHHFWLAENSDALYNAGGAAIRRDPTGQSGSDVGDELDLVLNFHVTNYSDILVSYGKLFGGDFLENTGGANQNPDVESFYLIFQQRW